MNWQVPFYAVLTAINFHYGSYATMIFTGVLALWAITMSAVSYYATIAPRQIGPRGETGATGMPGRAGRDYESGPSLKSLL